MTLYRKSAHVDWYSFTTILKSLPDMPEMMLDVATNSLRYRLGDDLFRAIFVDTKGWTIGLGRRPYSGGYQNDEIGIRVWYGGQHSVLVEFTGTGCEWLSGAGLLNKLIIATGERCTRIDIAVDVMAGGLVDAIADSAANNRIKTVARNESPTGLTRYIGSRKSEKLVRVYEYHEPHPRAGVTRVEYEHKKQQARITCGYVAAYGVEHTAKMCAAIYEWRHESVMNDEYVERMPSPVSEARTDAKTLHWIMKQVAPAIKKLIADGKIKNPQQWLMDTFMPSQVGEPGGNAKLGLFDE